MGIRLNKALSGPSPIQTLTVGPGISPDQRLLAGYTAGTELHRSPKDTIIILPLSISVNDKSLASLVAPVQ